MCGMSASHDAHIGMQEGDGLINSGARFDDRVTGRLDAFSPGSKKIHVDIDASSINKNVHVDVPIIGDCAHVLEDMLRIWKSKARRPDKAALADWWKQIDLWRERKSLSYKTNDEVIKPQQAIQLLFEMTRGRETDITTALCQHQLWAAQHYNLDAPNLWKTAAGRGT